MKRILMGLFWLVLASPAAGQTVVADRYRTNTGPCVIDGVDGTPDQIRLVGSCSGITTSAATNLTLMPNGDLVTNPSGKDILPDLNYDINIGMLSKKYLTLHAAELWVETLVAQNTIATIGGRVLVAPTTILTSDVGTGATSISVKHNNLANGDTVYLEADGKVEFMAITSAPTGSGPYTYTVTRNLDASGANQWYAGDAVLNTGATGKGYLDLYSVSGITNTQGTGIGPTVAGYVRGSSTYNDLRPRFAVGNLNGLYGYSADTFGFAAGAAFGTNITIDEVNGIRIRNSSTNKFTADTSGNLSIVGDLSVGTAGVIRINATAYGTGTGIWMDYNGGTPRFRVGNPAGAQLAWDGSTLTAAGWTLGATAIQDAAGVVGLSSAVTAGDDIRFWAGNATPSSAAFRVTESGALTSTSATITGAVTATSGAIGACSIGASALTCGAVTLDSDGITINSGTGSVNKVKWSSGAAMWAASNYLTMEASGSISFAGMGTTYVMDSSGLYNQNNLSLGLSGERWGTLYLANSINWSSPPTTTSNDYPLVYSVGNTAVYEKTDGYDGTCSSPTSITIERGIVTACS